MYRTGRETMFAALLPLTVPLVAVIVALPVAAGAV
jgi:hypothetical protein